MTVNRSSPSRPSIPSFLGFLAVLTASQAVAQAPRPPVSVPGQLMITSLAVVEDPVRTNARDPRNPWTFRHLVERMAGPRDPSQFVMDWLHQWEIDQPFPGGVARARPDVRRLVIDPWLAASGGSRLDLSRAPFKLLAVVNRMDLRDVSGTSVFSAGEGRFVFGVTRMDGTPLPPSAGPAPGGLFVIFEYELVATSQAQLRSWAESWASLGGKPVGSPDYNLALERVTRRFTDAAYAGRPNGSALAQLRTNDISLGPVWELREFALDQTAGLRQRPVAITPDEVRLNGTPAFARLINDNEPSLLDGTFVLPASMEAGGSLSGVFRPFDFPDFPLRTFTRIPVAPGLFNIPWSAGGVRNNDARHAFGLSTCNGCHRDDTGTGFVHVGFPAVNRLPASLGQPAALSGFLRGITIPDPVNPARLRTFNDLERRRRDLEGLFATLLGRTGTMFLPPPERIPMAPH